MYNRNLIITMSTSDYLDHVMDNLEHDDDVGHNTSMNHEMLDMCLPFCDDKCSEPRFLETAHGDEASDASTAATTPSLDTFDGTHSRNTGNPRNIHAATSGAAKSDSGSSPATPSTVPDGGTGGCRPPVESPHTTTVADSGGLFEAYCRAGAPVTSPYLQQHQITRRRCGCGPRALSAYTGKYAPSGSRAIA